MATDKLQQVRARMSALGIEEEDLIEKFILGSGSGGQKINKTSSCVYLKHLPSGIEVKCQKERSREMNRCIAREELCHQIEERYRQEKLAQRHQIEKKRRQRRKRSKAGQELVRQAKKRHSEKKNLRRYSDRE